VAHDHRGHVHDGTHTAGADGPDDTDDQQAGSDRGVQHQEPAQGDGRLTFWTVAQWTGTGAPACAMIHSTLDGAKNSAGEITPALSRAKASISSWLPWMAASSWARSGGGGSRAANWQVNSNIGNAWA